jgi:hypothetical protein
MISCIAREDSLGTSGVSWRCPRVLRRGFDGCRARREKRHVPLVIDATVLDDIGGKPGHGWVGVRSRWPGKCSQRESRDPAVHIGKDCWAN